MSLFENFSPFKANVISYLNRCVSAFEETGNTSASRNAESFIRDFDDLRYNLTIIGSLKRGKSTLLNALMERENDDISPIASQVCTSAIIKYIDKSLANDNDKTEKAIVYFNDGQMPCTVQLSRLRDYVTESNNPKNSKQVRSVDVFGDFPEWSKAVTIVDSPGQNAVYDYHDTLLSDFLPFTDAIIFLIAADLPCDGGDLKLLQELSKTQQRKIFFVITKIDNLDNPEDISLVKQHVMSVIAEKKICCEKLYTISAKPVFEALKNGVSGAQLEEIKAQNGILELESDLETFIIKKSAQTDILRKRVKTILDETKESCDQFIASSEIILSKQNFDIASLNSEITGLQDYNDELRKNTKKALRKFEQEWSRRLSSFSRKFSAKAPMIDDKIMDRLEKGGFFGAVFKSFKLKKEIEWAVGAELQPLVIDLEIQLQETVEKLNNEFDDEITVYMRKSKQGDIITPGISIATVAALGYTASWGFTTASTAFSTGMSALSTWGNAAGEAAITAAKFNNTSWIYGIRHILPFTTQTDKLATAVTTTAGNATAAAATTITTIVSSVISMGIAIAVTLIVQKLLHIGLTQIQGARVPAISEKIMAEMEASIFKGLEAMKNSIIEEYTQRIEDIINDNKEKIDEISAILIKNDPDTKMKLEQQITNIKALIPQYNHINSELKLLEE